MLEENGAAIVAGVWPKNKVTVTKNDSKFLHDCRLRNDSVKRKDIS